MEVMFPKERDEFSPSASGNNEKSLIIGIKSLIPLITMRSLYIKLTGTEFDLDIRTICIDHQSVTLGKLAYERIYPFEVLMD